MIAYIPARGGSKRIHRKNIKKLDGKPIIAHVIENTRKLDFISKVCVSTDDIEIKDIAESFGAETLALRSLELSDDSSGFIDLIHKDIPRFSELNNHDKEILFVSATAALVTPFIFREAYSIYMKERPEVLMGCIEMPVTAFFAMVQKKDGYWKPLFPEKVFSNTQDLPKTLVDSGLFHFFNLGTMKNYKSLKLVDRLYAYQIDYWHTVDVDTPEDWSILEEKYVRLKNKVFQGVLSKRKGEMP